MPLSDHRVANGFTAFHSPTLTTTASVSLTLGAARGERVEGALVETTALLRGPEQRIAFGVIHDRVQEEAVVHEMQFLLLPSEVKDAAVQGRTLCTLRTDASVRCAAVDGSDPERFEVVPDAEQLFLPTPLRRCVVRTGGSWACYGKRARGPWEREATLDQTLEAAGRAAVVVAGSRCFLSANHALVCLDEDALVTVVVLERVRQASVISAGRYHVGCAVRVDGTVTCWGGANETGTSGDGRRGSGEPAKVAVLADAVEVARSSDHACARTNRRRVYCWGAADGWAFGRRGLESAEEYRTCEPAEDARTGRCVPAALFGGTRNHLVLRPVEVPELRGVTSIAAGFQRTCGVRTDGRILCVGGGHAGPWTVDVGAR